MSLLLRERPTVGCRRERRSVPTLGRRAPEVTFCRPAGPLHPPCRHRRVRPITGFGHVRTVKGYGRATARAMGFENRTATLRLATTPRILMRVVRSRARAGARLGCTV